MRQEWYKGVWFTNSTPKYSFTTWGWLFIIDWQQEIGSSFGIVLLMLLEFYVRRHKKLGNTYSFLAPTQKKSGKMQHQGCFWISLQLNGMLSLISYQVDHQTKHTCILQDTPFKLLSIAYGGRGIKGEMKRHHKILATRQIH